MRVRDGALTLTTPTDVSLEDARAFIRKHFNWVDEQLKSEEATINALESADNPHHQATAIDLVSRQGHPCSSLS